MAYNKNTDWDNEEKYLDSLSQSGDAGTKAWAEAQKKELASAKAQYGTTSTSSPVSTSGGSSYTGVSSSGGSSGKSSGGNSQYTITSDKGKNIAETMKIGSTYTASDGSVWTKNNDGTITVNHGGVETKNAYTPTDYGTLGQLQMEAGLGWKDVLTTYNARQNKALTTEGLEQYANDDIQDAMMQYILEAQKKDNIKNAQTAGNEWYNSFTQGNAQPTYTSKYDPQIEALLKQILTRDDFSYNAKTDPLYKQYEAMYNREGDRAVRNTMAEAAANAGGMNSFAVTAAQQQANYYASQLNDKIPELYQLAYQMYLQDKESDVQDLGLLQNMDATQYNRYRDTMEDWKSDRNFAYGIYQDAVNQGEWQTEFDNTNYWKDKNFVNDNYWADKEYTDKQEQQNQEKALERLVNIIELGGTPDADLIASSGLSEYEVNLMMAAAQAEKADKQSEYTPEYTPPEYTPPEVPPDVQGVDTATFEQELEDTYARKGWTGVQKALKDALDEGVIKQSLYNKYYNEYRDRGDLEQDEEEDTETPLMPTGTVNTDGLGLGPISEEKALELINAGLAIIDSKNNVSWAAGVNASNYYDKLMNSKSGFENLFANLFKGK